MMWLIAADIAVCAPALIGLAVVVTVKWAALATWDRWLAVRAPAGAEKYRAILLGRVQT